MPEVRTKTCKECESPFDPIRLDQSFCGRKCRNAYHNRFLINDNRFTKSTDNVLHNNRKILSGINKAVIKKEDLLKKGFNFKYITDIFMKEKKTYFGCYNFCYMFLDNSTVKIFSR